MSIHRGGALLRSEKRETLASEWEEKPRITIHGLSEMTPSSVEEPDVRETFDRRWLAVRGWSHLGENGGERACSTWLAVFENGADHVLAEMLTSEAG